MSTSFRKDLGDELAGWSLRHVWCYVSLYLDVLGVVFWLSAVWFLVYKGIQKWGFLFLFSLQVSLWCSYARHPITFFVALGIVPTQYWLSLFMSLCRISNEIQKVQSWQFWLRPGHSLVGFYKVCVWGKFLAQLANVEFLRKRWVEFYLFRKRWEQWYWPVTTSLSFGPFCILRKLYGPFGYTLNFIYQ